MTIAIVIFITVAVIVIGILGYQWLMTRRVAIALEQRKKFERQRQFKRIQTYRRQRNLRLITTDEKGNILPDYGNFEHLTPGQQRRIKHTFGHSEGVSLEDIFNV